LLAKGKEGESWGGKGEKEGNKRKRKRRKQSKSEKNEQVTFLADNFTCCLAHTEAITCYIDCILFVLHLRSLKKY